MSDGTDFGERLVEAVELGVFELVVVEAEEVVHDDVAGERWEGVGEVEGFLAGGEVLDADAEGVDVAVDDVDEVEDGAAGEPGGVSGCSEDYGHIEAP